MLPKPIRLVGILFFIIMALYAGQLCIRRAIVEKSDLRIIKSKVISKRINYSTSGKTNKSRNYHIEFEIENSQERIAINFPTSKQAYQDSTLNKIDTGKVYKFYLDNTYPTFLNKTDESSYFLNKGVEIIENNTGIIFSKPHTLELGGGLFFILLSITCTFLAVKYRK